MILVSACLIGYDVKYDGSNNFTEIINSWLDHKKAVPVCPEVLGGLSIPRDPAEIVGAAWDEVIAEPEVVALIARMVSEGKLESAVIMLKNSRKCGSSLSSVCKASRKCRKTSGASCGFTGRRVW